MVALQLRIEEQFGLGDEGSPRLSSNQGNFVLSGFSNHTLRVCSQSEKKFCTSDSRERESANIRRTCCSSTAGSRSLLLIARSSSVSSGMLLHKANDRREANSTSGTL